MPAFRDMPIRRQLLAVTLLVAVLALFIAGTAVIVSESLLFRASMQHELEAFAEIVGDNSTAALQFDDPSVANDTLNALHARPHMVSACLYTPDGALFASYLRPGTSQCAPLGIHDGVHATTAAMTATHSIMLENRKIGTLTLRYDTGELAERTRLYAAIVLGILVASILIAFVLASRLRNTIAGPIARLATAAASVSKGGDYTLRVSKDSGHEVGALVDAFNGMLGAVQSRERELRDARNSLQTTLTSIGDAVISTDTEGRIVFANPVACALLRCPVADLHGRQIDSVFRIVNEFSRAPVENPVHRVLRERVIAGLENHTILIAADGFETPIDDSAAPIQQDGQLLGVVLVFRDVTERRRAQRDAAYLAAIVQSFDDAIVGTSPQGVVQTWNDGAERLFGYSAAEMIGRPMRAIIPADRQQEEDEILHSILAGKPVVHFETVRLRKDGSSLEISLTVSPIRDKSARLVGISRVAHDITEQKRQAEQMRQTQKLESLGVLAGGIAHDFNNLLTGILGNASLALEDAQLHSATREAIAAVIEASDRAAQLARQMLAYSGKGRFVVEDIDFSARVRETLPLIRSAIHPRVELKLDLAKDLPSVEADPAQIQQLMMNLIINGAESIPEGKHGVVEIATRLIDNAAAPQVLFEVRDTGAGMSEETMARIFDPFFTTKFTGRGLGLSAVMGIVRGHKGSIEVSSVPGQGTVFSVLLPASAGRNAESAELPAASATPAASLRGTGLVLVVDDEPVVRKLAAIALERAGYTVALAEDGARGVEAFLREAGRLRCVILDMTMPVMSGEEALAHMKSIRAEIPIILSSGFNEAQAVRQFEGKGLAGFLQKPYKAAALLDLVRKFAPGA
jgi:two-component system cell cycle sensor histidine kinase/response regulator CckA